MMDLSHTIQPKSDQLNADDLTAGQVDVTIDRVIIRKNQQQPVDLALCNGLRPYRPCLSMRRLLVSLWGKDGNKWAGKRLRLYRDDNVQYGGKDVGGVRISHVSDIGERFFVLLTAKRGRRVEYYVDPLPDSSDEITEIRVQIKQAQTSRELESAKKKASALENGKEQLFGVFREADERIKSGIDCPGDKGKVTAIYCNSECKTREGCKAHE